MPKSVTTPNGLGQYVLIALRFAFIVTVAQSAYQTNLNGSPLTTAVLAALWAPYGAVALEDTWRMHDDVAASLVLSFVTILATALVLTLDSAVDLVALWIVPATLTWILLVVQDLVAPVPQTRDSSQIQQYNRTWGVWMGILVTSSALADVFLFGTSQTSTLVLTCLQCVVSLLLVVWIMRYGEPVSSSVWKGGSTLVLLWVYAQACVLPMLSPLHFGIRFAILVAVLAASVFGTQYENIQHTRCQRWALTIQRVAQSLGQIIVLVVSSAFVWQFLAFVASIAVLICVNEPWWSSHVDFPPGIQEIANIVMDIVDTVVKPVYQFTDDPEFQKIMAVALQEIAGVRSAIYRTLVPIWVYLIDAKYGRDYTMVPLQAFVRVVFIVLGPCLAILGVLLTVFPSGRKFSESPWFWAAISSTSTMLLVVTQWTPDATVLFIHFVLEDTTYTRTYTSSGTQASIALSVLVAASAVLFIRGSVLMTIEIHRAKVAAGTSGVGREVIKYASEKVCGCTRRAWRRFSELFSTSTVVLAIGLFVLVMTILTTGSPIQGIDIKTLPKKQPDWLVSTTLDKFSALTVSLVEMLGPEARLALFIDAMMLVAVDALNCWGCLCVPDVVGAAESAWDAISGLFSRRRLLEYSFADPITFQPLDIGRKLLESQFFGVTCQGPITCGRGLTKLCVLDTIGDVAEKITQLQMGALKAVFDIVVHQILGRIPVFNVLEGLLGRLLNLDDYANFNPWNGIDFGFSWKMFGIDFGLLPRIKLFPGIGAGINFGYSAVALLFILGLAVVLAWQLGLLLPVTSAITCGLQMFFVLVIAGFALGGTLLIFFFVDEARIYGYDVRFQLNQNVVSYAIALSVMVLSLLLRVGEMIDGMSQVAALKSGTSGRGRSMVELERLVKD